MSCCCCIYVRCLLILIVAWAQDKNNPITHFFLSVPRCETTKNDLLWSLKRDFLRFLIFLLLFLCWFQGENNIFYYYLPKTYLSVSFFLHFRIYMYTRHTCTKQTPCVLPQVRAQIRVRTSVSSDNFLSFKIVCQFSQRQQHWFRQTLKSD